VTDTERIERIQADRKAAGLPPLIQSEVVYRLLGAVIDASNHSSPAKEVPAPTKAS
jgi:hypothetical protein